MSGAEPLWPGIAVRSAQELSDVVLAALGDGTVFALEGRGSKRALGHTPKTARRLSLKALSGVVFYEPEELVIRVGAGTPLTVVEEALAEKQQHLAFEPPQWDGFALGGAAIGGAAGATIGGVISCNLSGPRRFKAGAARDYVLGLRCVNGRGEELAFGGRVMKNVTGYDMCKLLCGSYGTLAAITEVTLKVLPAPTSTATLILAHLSVDEAALAMRLACASHHEVCGAAYLPAKVAVSGFGSCEDAVVLRLEGTARSVAARLSSLEEHIGAQQSDLLRSPQRLETEAARALWHAIAEVTPLFPDSCGEGGDYSCWRLSCAPAAWPRLISAFPPEALWFVDNAGSWLWLALPATVTQIRDFLPPSQAFLIAASAGAAQDLSRFPLLPAGERALSARIKAAFDPAGVFNPQRMHAAL